MPFCASADQLEPLSCAAFRRAIFRGLRVEEVHIRSATLDLISQKVEKWTKEFYSGVASNTPPPSAGPLQRHDSARLDFSDVFDNHQHPLDMEEGQSSETVYVSPLTPDDSTDAGVDNHDGRDDDAPAEGPRLLKICYSCGNLYKFDDAQGRDFCASLEGFRDETLTFDEMSVHLRGYYIALLRMTIDCSYPDVRSGCKAILKRVKNAGADLPYVPTQSPSYLIPLNETIGLEAGNAAHQLMMRGHNPATLSPSSSVGSRMNELSDEDEDISRSPCQDGGIRIPGPFRASARLPNSSLPGRGSRRHGDRPPGEPASHPSPFDHRPSRTRPKVATNNIPNQEVQEKPLPASEEVLSFQRATFSKDGRFTNLNKILSYFPTFFNANSQVLDVLMNRSGTAFPRTWKFYLGIMAAAEHKCQYFISLCTSRFLDCNGDRDWLKGLQNAHPKLQRIRKLNAMLAHQPWRLDPTIIRELVKGVDEDGHRCEPNENCHNWSTTEIILAIAVLSYYHCQSALALGLGIVPEADTPGGYILPPSMKSSTLLMTPMHVPVATSNNLGDNLEDSSPISISKPEVGPGSLPGPSMRRKRTKSSSSAENLEKTTDGPDKWLKTPNGSLPNAHVFPSRPSTGNRPPSHPRRRKSFEECTASDEDPSTPMTSGTNSASAPTSYNPASILNQQRLGYDRAFFFSPSSSTASMFEASQKATMDQAPVNQIVEDSERFLRLGDEVSAVHEDFDVDSPEYSFLPMEDFDWDTNACEIIGEFVDGLEDIIDGYFMRVRDIREEFVDEDMNNSGSISGPNSHVDSSILSPGADLPFFDPSEDHPQNDNMTQEWFFNLSQNSSPSQLFRQTVPYIGGSNPDIPPSDIKSLKEAVWYYSLRLLGIQKDDYPYSDIRKLLNKETRIYLKRVCTDPAHLTRKDWRAVKHNRSSEEMVLMCLVATQARFMGELLYGVKAVSDYRELAH